MSAPSKALESLTATYTDSEGEEGAEDNLQEDSNTPKGAISQNDDSQAYVSSRSNSSSPNSPVNSSVLSGKNNAFTSNSAIVVPEPTKIHRLVSYFDDTIASDDEGNGPATSAENPQVNGKPSTEEMEHQSPEHQGNNSEDEADLYGVTIPSEPPGKCPPELQDKITGLYKKMELGRSDMNKMIQQRKDFRNPSIYEKLIQFCNINELGTNYPPERFDPFRWSKDSFYEELAKVQKIEMEKLEKARKQKTTIEIVSGTAKRPNSSAPNAEEDAKKRKSKWDQVSSTTTAVATTAVKLSNTSQTLTISTTKTQTTLISAFGSLPKKRL